jgi:cell division transport system ATP-binding protein
MIPQLVPQEERGAAATAALTAVQEVQRETESLEPLTAEMIASMKAARDAETDEPVAPATAVPRTHPIVLPEVDVAELGVADRLGLSAADDDDEVGPTS